MQSSIIHNLHTISTPQNFDKTILVNNNIELTSQNIFTLAYKIKYIIYSRLTYYQVYSQISNSIIY